MDSGITPRTPIFDAGIYPRPWLGLLIFTWVVLQGGRKKHDTYSQISYLLKKIVQKIFSLRCGMFFVLVGDGKCHWVSVLQSYYNHRHSNPITILKSLTKRRSFRSPIYHHDRNRLKSLSCCRNNSSRICKKIYIYRGIFKDYTILILWLYGQIILLRDHLDVSLPCSLQSCWTIKI